MTDSEVLVPPPLVEIHGSIKKLHFIDTVPRQASGSPNAIGLPVVLVPRLHGLKNLIGDLMHSTSSLYGPSAWQ